MKILPMLVCVFASIGACDTSRAQQAYEINLHRENAVYFSDDDTPDLLTVDVFGSKPYDAVILITIRRAGDRYPVFTDAVTAGMTSPINWQRFKMDDLNSLLSRILHESTQRTADLPSWESLEKDGLFCDSLEICPHVDRDIYARVRSSGRPLFCYLVHYETIRCAWFDAEQGSARIVTVIAW